MVPFERRDKDTLLPIIQKYILPESSIISDCWRPYGALNEMNYKHLTVNHSKTFKDPETGACTNTIEGLWRHAKYYLPQYHREKNQYLGYLAKYLFIKKAEMEGKEPLEEFFRQVSILNDSIGIKFSEIVDLRSSSDVAVYDSEEDDDVKYALPEKS